MIMPVAPIKSEQRIYRAHNSRKSGIASISGVSKRVIPETLINLEDSGDFMGYDDTFLLVVQDPQISHTFAQVDGGTQTEVQ